MKILELRFKNLNSLYGEWTIDFTSTEYIVDGIFAITGPTGAGKSTILDAICLALYGATPRLGRITGSRNEIMSRQTGECYAEVTFEAQGDKYRCHWSQHKARRKIDGNLVDSKHEIADALNGDILESKKRDVAEVIEKKTGMDFERFTRSILLAQGGFDTFLKADSDKRAPILEQITGTEIYSEISKRVHVRKTGETEKLNILQAETSGIVILTAEEKSETVLSLAGKLKEETIRAEKHKKLVTSIQWLAVIEALQKEISVLAVKEVELERDFKEFQPERQKLNRAIAAAELDGVFGSLKAIRLEQKRDLSAYSVAEKQLPEITEMVARHEKLLRDAEAVTAKIQTEQKSLAPLLQRVRALDQHLSEKKKHVENSVKNCRKLESLIDQQKAAIQKTNVTLSAGEKDLRRILQYQVENSSDEILVTQFTGIKEQLYNLHAARKELAVKKESLLNAEKKRKNLMDVSHTRGRAFAGCQKKQKVAQELVEQNRDVLKTVLDGKLLREYRTEKEMCLREIALIQKIARLEAERKRLQDGVACPLCGAKEHPYATGNIPEMDGVEQRIKALGALIEKAENLENDSKKLEVAVQTGSEEVSRAEKLVAAAESELKNHEKNMAGWRKEITSLMGHCEQRKITALERLQPYGVCEIDESDIENLLDRLEVRFTKWKKQQAIKETIEKQSIELTGELKKSAAVITAHQKALTEELGHIEGLKKECVEQQTERNHLFGVKKPDVEESRLGKKQSLTDAAEKNARKERESGVKKLSSVKARMASLEDGITKRAVELEAQEVVFTTGLTTFDFADEQEFTGHRLSTKERNELAVKAKELDDSRLNIQSRTKDRTESLKKETQKKITESSMAELEPERLVVEENLKTIRDEIGGIKQRLADNRAAQERIKDKQGLIEAQKSECQRWDKLHSLIGSADGKKYRNFAQGLTFELMVSHANLQLEKMTDRYLLIRDDLQPLELNVVDNYQAGEIRSTKNLSGGESFVVSLSLALGLSKMASRKVRVDSLFLDEGFGTLDEDALETALETLSGLQQDGKVIGVISHVSALKERVATQINIIPLSGGKSSVVGPGCIQTDG